jgi:hypothetical protein
MLHPAPTDKIDTGLTRGVLEETLAETATNPAFVVIGLYNSDYRLHLVPAGEITATQGKRIIGVDPGRGEAGRRGEDRRQVRRARARAAPPRSGQGRGDRHLTQHADRRRRRARSSAA